jgi:hypothetical protein
MGFKRSEVQILSPRPGQYMKDAGDRRLSISQIVKILWQKIGGIVPLIYNIYISNIVRGYLIWGVNQEKKKCPHWISTIY